MSKKLILGLVIAFLVGIFLSPFASSHPDGLERVAEDQKFLESAAGQEVLQSPVPDYAMPGIANEAVATGAAGALGVLLTFGVVLGLKKLLVKSSDAT